MKTKKYLYQTEKIENKKVADFLQAVNTNNSKLNIKEVVHSFEQSDFRDALLYMSKSNLLDVYEKDSNLLFDIYIKQHKNDEEVRFYFDYFLCRWYENYKERIKKRQYETRNIIRSLLRHQTYKNGMDEIVFSSKKYNLTTKDFYNILNIIKNMTVEELKLNKSLSQELEEHIQKIKDFEYKFRKIQIIFK